MLVLFRVRLSNEKIRQNAALPDLQSSEELKADLLTKPAVISVFTLFGLEFGETEYLPTSQAIGD